MRVNSDTETRLSLHCDWVIGTRAWGSSDLNLASRLGWATTAERQEREQDYRGDENSGEDNADYHGKDAHTAAKVSDWIKIAITS